MVKKKQSFFSPSICLALPALVVFYIFQFCPLVSVVICLCATLALFSFLTALRFSLSDESIKRTVFIFLCVTFGILGGLCSVFRLHRDNAPVRTLASIERVSEITVELLSDPAPTGSDVHYATCRVISLTGRDSSVFSADGRCMVFFPSALIRASLPGGINGALSRTVLFSSGLHVSLYGVFLPPIPGKPASFRASGVVQEKDVRLSPVDRLRALLRLSLMRKLYDWNESGGFLLALLSGNRDYLDPALAEDFKSTGLSHILALSGMHLSLLSLVAVRFGKRIGGKRVSIRLSLFAILFFVWFAGFSPSLSRALLMALLLMLLGRLGFQGDILQVLSLTAFIQLMWNPLDAQSVAFMLSYGALAGILTFGESIVSLIPARGRTPVSDSLSASLGAQLMTSPVTAVIFGVLAPVGIVASCAASPLSSIFMVAGMFFVAVSSIIPPLSAMCGTLLDVLYDVTAGSVRVFSGIPPLSITALPATIAACVIPLTAGLALVFLETSILKRRSVDDRFAGL
jgi:competence protein ComEC